MARPSLNFGNSRAITASRSRSPAICSTKSAALRRTPRESRRGSISPRSSCQRARLMIIAPSAGSGSPSAMCRKESATLTPSLMSGIELLLERGQAEAAIGVEEALALLAAVEIDIDDRLHRIDDAVGGEGRADDVADAGVLVGAAAEGDLVELLALLVDAQDADMADMMVAAGVDAAGDLDAELADLALALRIGEAGGDALGDGDRACIGEAAIVQPRASDDVAHEADIGRRETERREAVPERRKVSDSSATASI